MRQQVADNPLPVTVMGAGLAWLAMAGRGRTNSHKAPDVSAYRVRETDAGRIAAGMRQSTEEWGKSAGSAASKMSERAADAASDMQQAAQSTGASIVDAAKATYGDLSQRAGEAGSSLQSAGRSAADSITEAASAASGFAARQARSAGDQLRGSASALRDNVAGSGRGVLDFLYEQPLVLAGIGVAIGAAIGAALPVTETENEMMGEHSDALKQQTAEVAEEQLDKGKAAAGRAWQGASEEFKDQSSEAAAVGPHAAGEAPLVPQSEGAATEESEPLGHG
ncbi:MAG TPA: hypothetical protein VFL51_17225 [Pseudolabrys sp.]|nr:hypothetical protein [Pseudolabrys sp.]